MSRSTVPAMTDDVVALLKIRAFDVLRKRQDGSITVMRNGPITVYSRAAHPRYMISADHVSSGTNVDRYANDADELESVLNAIRKREDKLDDAVRTLADVLWNHFHKNNVKVMLNHPRVGRYEFYTHNTHSSVMLFKLDGTMDHWDEIEIEMQDSKVRTRTGPIATLDEALAVFKEWSELSDTTARECHSDYMITLEGIHMSIYAMLYRGLNDIAIKPFYVKLVCEGVPELQKLIDRHHNEERKSEEHIAYVVTWKFNQQQCEEMEGLHA